jgi:hypothetical protein
MVTYWVDTAVVVRADRGRTSARRGSTVGAFLLSSGCIRKKEVRLDDA